MADNNDNENLFHLFWGVTLFGLYVVLASIVAPLMRITAPLTLAQAYAIFNVGEVVSFLPLIPTTKRRWSISTRVGILYFTESIHTDGDKREARSTGD